MAPLLKSKKLDLPQGFSPNRPLRPLSLSIRCHRARILKVDKVLAFRRKATDEKRRQIDEYNIHRSLIILQLLLELFHDDFDILGSIYHRYDHNFDKVNAIFANLSLVHRTWHQEVSRYQNYRALYWNNTHQLMSCLTSESRQRSLRRLAMTNFHKPFPSKNAIYQALNNLSQFTELRLLFLGVDFAHKIIEPGEFFSKLGPVLKHFSRLESLSIMCLNEADVRYIPSIFFMTKPLRDLKLLVISGWIPNLPQFVCRDMTDSYGWEGLKSMTEEDLFAPNLQLLMFMTSVTTCIPQYFIKDMPFEKKRGPSDVTLVMDEGQAACVFLSICYRFINRVNFRSFPEKLYTMHMKPKVCWQTDYFISLPHNTKHIVTGGFKRYNDNLPEKVENGRLYPISLLPKLESLTIVDTSYEKELLERSLEKIYAETVAYSGFKSTRLTFQHCRLVNKDKLMNKCLYSPYIPKLVE